MSAGTIPELEQLTATTVGTAPARRSAGDPLDVLCERFAALCGSAVDLFEIAAGLEADGMSDQSARVGYGYPDIFALAEELYRRTPRRPVEPAAEPDPWRTTIGRHVLHGLLFGLPALCYPVAAPLLSGGSALALLIVSMLVSWSASQGMAYLGYVRLGRGDLDGSRRVLRSSLVICAALVLGALWLAAALLGHSGGVLWFAAGQGIYLLAATVALVCGADLLLLGALAPGVLVSTGYLVFGQPGWLRPVAWLALGATLLLAVVLAVVRTTWPRPAASRAVRLAEIRGALPYAAFGVLVAGLLVFPLVEAQLARQSFGDGAAAMTATLPLSLSMGMAEWTLYWYRGRIRRLLRNSRLLSEFGGRSRLVLVSALGWYLLAAAVLIGAVAALAGLLGVSPQWIDVIVYGGYLSLGGALFLALLLQACGDRGPALIWCAAALAIDSLLMLVDRHAAVVLVQLVTGGGLLLVLLIHACLALSRAARHR